LTLSAALAYDHLGARDGNGILDYLPQVADETRNVVIASQNGAGTRGIVIFTDRANININAAAFDMLGRTTSAPIDNTTFDSNGGVTHIGTNEADRVPVQFRHLWGPTLPQADGYQYTFVGNVVDCPMVNQTHVWGIEINDSHYGLLQGNVVDNWSGAGIAAVTGDESSNLIRGNFVARINGTGQRTDTGLDGLGYWFRGPNNAVVNNVATDINAGGAYSYGFDVNATYLGTVQIPAAQGDDPALSGQSTSVNMNATPLLQFSGNEVYGATPNGLSLWWIGAFFTTPEGNAGTVEQFQAWDLYQWSYFGYESDNLTLDKFTVRGDLAADDQQITRGMWFSDYYQRGLVVSNADIQGENTGILTPETCDGQMTIENSYFRDATDVQITTMANVNGAGWLPAKSTVLQNDQFDAPQGLSLTAIDMDYETSGVGSFGAANLIQTDTAFVYNYDNTSGDNFQVYYNQQVASFVVPQSSGGMIGSPVSGLTNAQNWSKYGIAIAGAIAPSTATTRTGVIGLVQTLSNSPQSASPKPATSKAVKATPASADPTLQTSGGSNLVAAPAEVGPGVPSPRFAATFTRVVDDSPSRASRLPAPSGRTTPFALIAATGPTGPPRAGADPLSSLESCNVRAEQGGADRASVAPRLEPSAPSPTAPAPRAAVGIVERPGDSLWEFANSIHRDSRAYRRLRPIQSHASARPMSQATSIAPNSSRRRTSPTVTGAPQPPIRAAADGARIALHDRSTGNILMRTNFTFLDEKPWRAATRPAAP
jgi:hypothetical protein